VLWLLAVAVAVVAVTIYDLVQRRHAILRNFPILGHFRYLFEAVGPELRQYIVTGNDEERPFSRDERRWVYASAKRENNYFGFGSDNEMETAPNYLVVKHSAFPLSSPHPGDPGFDPAWPLAAAKILGGARGRAKAFRPASVVNLSGMSFGSLSARAVEAMAGGARLAGCLHNTGEGGLTSYHRHGADLVWQVGTGYFGCRDEAGRFSLERLLDVVAGARVRAIELKLSQGAKPGLGGVLPGRKVTAEIAAIRGIPAGRDCVSPAAHTAFSDVDSMLDFVELLAERTGLPVGIKSAVGQSAFWVELAERMAAEPRGVDFVVVDGGEGGTGAGPRTFTDHVGLPFKVAFTGVYRIFAERGVAERLVWIGSGKLGFPERALLAFGMGCDMVNVGREAMFAIGCIQAQRCQTDRCPTGVTTHNRWLVRGLDPTDKAARLANYIVTLRQELTLLARACGVAHPSEITLDHFDVLDDAFGARSAREVFGYRPGWGSPAADRRGRAEDHITIRLPVGR
jgi:glutamate synthase (ferredoxin)